MPANHASKGAFRLATKTVTFDGTAGAGAIGDVNLFTVTGQVLLLYICGRCATDLAGATATVSLGVGTASSQFIAATTATGIDAGMEWVDNSPAANAEALPAACKEQILVASPIKIVVATAAVTAGVLTVFVYWLPLSADGALTPV